MKKAKFGALEGVATAAQGALANTAVQPALLYATARQRLNTSRTIFVNKDGSDVSNSGDEGSPFATIQKAIDTALRTDFMFNQIVIKVADHTTEYEGYYHIMGCPPWANMSEFRVPLLIEGNTTNPLAVKLKGGFKASGGAKISVKGFAFSTNEAGRNALEADGAGSEFHTGFVSMGQLGTNGDHFKATDGGSYYILNNYQIRGGALNHHHVTEGSHARINYGVQAAVTGALGSLHFTGQFAGVASSDLFCIGYGFTGDYANITGRRYLVHLGGIIRTNLNNRYFFPGSTGGYEQSGGRMDEGAMFTATKDGSTAQSINAGEWTKVTWTETTFQLGNGFDHTGNRWFARNGFVEINAQVAFTSGLVEGQIMAISIRKGIGVGEAVEYRTVVNLSHGSSVPQILNISLQDRADGDSYYEVWVRADGTGAKQISGSRQWTFFEGKNV